jgi:hypothetical protein
MSVGGLALIGGIGVFYTGLTQTVDDKNAYQSQLFLYNQTVSGNPYTTQQPPVEPDGTQHFPQMIGGIVLVATGAVAATVGTLIYIRGKRQQKRNNHLSAVVLPHAFRIAYTF